MKKIWFLFVWLLCPAFLAHATSYYIKNGGNDNLDGHSDVNAWASFTRINATQLSAGDAVYLKCGSTWTGPLHPPTAKGTAVAHITLTSYGSGNMPVINGASMTTGACIQIEGASWWDISGIACQNSKLGLYLRYYADFNNTNVNVTWMSFTNMSDVSDTGGVPGEYVVASGIYVGGLYYQDGVTRSPVLTNLLVQNCAFSFCEIGFTDCFWYPGPVYRGILVNPKILNCWCNNYVDGLFCMQCTNGGLIQSCQTYAGLQLGSPFAPGTCGGLLTSSQNTVIDNCGFADCRRAPNSNDGVGLDMDDGNINCTVSNCVFRNNDGAGLEFLIPIQGSPLGSTGYTIQNNTFYNDCLNPPPLGYGYIPMNCEIVSVSTAITGTLTNNGLYKSNANPWLNGYMTGFSQSNNRQRTWSTVSGYARVWDWSSQMTNNPLGWNGWYQWGSESVGSDGHQTCLWGVATGATPYGYSPINGAGSNGTWIDTTRWGTIQVKMQQTYGPLSPNAKIYFVTETDGTWNEAKSISWPLAQDYGVQHVYNVDLTQCPSWKGVVIGVRLDPVYTSGTAWGIQYLSTLSGYRPY